MEAQHNAWNLTGTQGSLQTDLSKMDALAEMVTHRVQLDIKKHPYQLLPYQAMALYILAKQSTGNILEIGTCLGYSAAVMAEANPRIEIVTLEPDKDRFRMAKINLAKYPNVTVLNKSSEEYYNLKGIDEKSWGMIFVDGDHTKAGVEFDTQWFNRLAFDGLILFHDFSLATDRFVVVYDTVLKMMRTLQRCTPDVLLVDGGNRGMVGFYRRKGEILQ